MLYLTRKVGESVVINDTVEVTVIEVRGKSIKLGFTFPPEVSVLRREIHDRIMEENKAAAGGGGLPPQDLTGTNLDRPSEPFSAPKPQAEAPQTESQRAEAPRTENGSMPRTASKAAGKS